MFSIAVVLCAIEEEKMIIEYTQMEQRKYV